MLKEMILSIRLLLQGRKALYRFLNIFYAPIVFKIRIIDGLIIKKEL